MIKKKDNGGGDYNGITRGLPNTSYSILLVYVMNHIAYYWFMWWIIYRTIGLCDESYIVLVVYVMNHIAY